MSKSTIEWIRCNNEQKHKRVQTFQSSVEVFSIGHFQTRMWHEETIDFAKALTQTGTN